MSEIPDDIIETAREMASASIADDAGNSLRYFLGQYEEMGVTVLANAILSERQRHAEVMEEVRKVLEPFAEEAAVYDPDTGDGDDVVWATPAYFRINHLRAARALLSRMEER